MIKRFDKKVTPKQYAAAVVRSNLSSADYWHEQEDLNGMTEKEKEQIDKQITKFQNRFNKVLENIIYGKKS